LVVRRHGLAEPDAAGLGEQVGVVLADRLFQDPRVHHHRHLLSRRVMTQDSTNGRSRTSSAMTYLCALAHT
jgi:hypothetical protein